jgi:cysteine desulfurase / selenocysteine lyase
MSRPAPAAEPPAAPLRQAAPEASVRDAPAPEAPPARATPAPRAAASFDVAPFDVEAVRRDFPLLARYGGGDHPLVYLDNAATTQKPRAVLEAEARYYEETCSNVHRGVYGLAARATAEYENAREAARRFLGAVSSREVVFTRGTTEAINLVAQTLGRQRLAGGGAVLLTGLEHHSNIVPWQLVCEQVGGRLVVAPIDDRGEVVLEEYERLLGEGVAIAAFAHVSNALGTVNPVAEMTAMAHRHGAVVVVDGAQAAPHLPLDVGALGCDFFAFSGHKVFGPTGIGVLWGRYELLAAMPPYQGGGEMIRSVTFAKTEYAPPPERFEAGTPNVAGAIGLAPALKYLEGLGRERVAACERELLAHATEEVGRIPGVTIVGTAREKASVLSFVLEGIHAHDVGTILDSQGICVRAGHHCAQPVMDRFGVPATARASFALYNTHQEVERLAAGLRRVREVFA